MTIKKIRLISDFAVRLDDTTWPRAYGRTGDLNWLLRYGSDEEVMKQRLVIASILGAYSDLVYATRDRRQEVVSALRKADDMAFATLTKRPDQGGK